jgi:hypothetical protein
MDLNQLLQRELGKGLMTGGSPTSRRTQAINALQNVLSTHTQDPWGSLSEILLRWLENDASLSNNLDQPTMALTNTIDHILASDASLEEFVRQVDTHYAERFQERPIFQKAGDKENPDDEYTHQSVSAILKALRTSL